MSEIIYTHDQKKCQYCSENKLCRSCAAKNRPKRTQESFDQQAKTLSMFYENKRNKAIIEYNKNPKLCKYCNTPIPFENKNNQYCNHTCSASYNNSKRAPRSIDSREKTRKSVNEILKNGGYIPKKGPECSLYKHHGTKKTYYFNLTENKTIYLQSSWEYKIAQYLDNKNIKWIRPKPLPYTIDKPRQYFPDFYLPDHNVYFDPKNPYVLQQDQEKLNAVITKHKITLICGNYQEIIKYIDMI